MQLFFWRTFKFSLYPVNLQEGLSLIGFTPFVLFSLHFSIAFGFISFHLFSYLTIRLVLRIFLGQTIFPIFSHVVNACSKAVFLVFCPTFVIGYPYSSHLQLLLRIPKNFFNGQINRSSTLCAVLQYNSLVWIRFAISLGSKFGLGGIYYSKFNPLLTELSHSYCGWSLNQSKFMTMGTT